MLYIVTCDHRLVDASVSPKPTDKKNSLSKGNIFST